MKPEASLRMVFFRMAVGNMPTAFLLVDGSPDGGRMFVHVDCCDVVGKHLRYGNGRSE